MKQSILAAGWAASKSQGGTFPSGNPLRIPPDWSSGVLTVAEAAVQIWPGQNTTVLAVNGQVPGPTIRLRKGEVFSAEIRNELTSGQDMVLHWHGLLAPPANDGHPRQAIPPGSSYNISFPIVQEPSMCLYHSHAHGLTGEHVYKGVAGVILIEDPDRDAALGLPAGSRDIPLVIKDWKSNGSYSLDYNPSMFEHMWGFLGDQVLVNGTPNAWLAVDQGLWRFRLLNASNARVYRLGFTDGRPMMMIATDGGLTGRMDSVNLLDLAPGQRVEILVSFADLAVGSTALLRSFSYTEGRPGGGPAGPRQGDQLDVMEFYVATAGGSLPVPATPPAPGLPDAAHAVRTRVFTLAVSNGSHTINGQTYDLARTDFEVPAGEVEIWRFVNQSGMHHPMHMHGTFFSVLTRNGSPATGPMDQGLHDTILVYPQETVEVAVVFGARSGEYLLHCHNLEHEHQMMQNFNVVAAIRPHLDIVSTESGISCRWPANFSGWRLEVSNDMVTWAPLPGFPGTLGSDLEWLLPPGAARGYQRLALQ